MGNGRKDRRNLGKNKTGNGAILRPGHMQLKLASHPAPYANPVSLTIPGATGPELHVWGGINVMQWMIGQVAPSMPGATPEEICERAYSLLEAHDEFQMGLAEARREAEEADETETEPEPQPEPEEELPPAGEKTDGGIIVGE